MAVHVRTVVRPLAPLLVAATLLVPASAPADPASTPGDCPRLERGTDATWVSVRPEDGSTCVTLPYPERSDVRPMAAVGEQAGWLSVVNAAGEELCGTWAWESGRCRLEAPRPYTLVRSGGAAGTPVHVAVARLDRPTGCTELASGDWGTDEGVTVAHLLEEHGVVDVDVTGLATDYCVRASALDAIEHGRHVRILTDLVAGVAPESSEASLAELAHAGAELVESGV